MQTIKIIIGKSDGTIERNVLLLRNNEHISNAIMRYGSARRAAYRDIVGITYQRGYVWRGEQGNLPSTPALDKWVQLHSGHSDADTWDTLHPIAD